MEAARIGGIANRMRGATRVANFKLRFVWNRTDGAKVAVLTYDHGPG
jgi:hypothetical protein